VKVRFSLSIVALVAGALAGCSRHPEASFVANEKRLESLLPEARAEIGKILDESFGTPNRLVAWERFPFDYGKAEPATDEQPAREEGWRLKEGRNLYMTHCLHCHGVSGDGNGPTAKFLNPLPRDYRQGIFKFKSTVKNLLPQKADLKHTLEHGVPGTYMPSFVLLGEERLDLIIDYVRWLSTRGRMEIRLALEFEALGTTDSAVDDEIANADDEIANAEGKKKPKKPKRRDVVKKTMESAQGEIPRIIEEVSTELKEGWEAAESAENVIVPKVKRTPPTRKSIDHGKDLFLSKVQGKKTECSECHGLLGRGDGPNTEKFWPVRGSTPEVLYPDPGLHDDWGHRQTPRDLTRGVYRGGRRPIDIFRRVYNGINGTQMPGFGGTILTDEEVWDVVNYVLSIPFEGKHSAYPVDPDEQQQSEKEQVAAARE
jgi:mono/diheme cytochrome c family protein